MSEMKETTGRQMQLSSYVKALTAGSAKNGKTTFLVSSLLGVLPWQQFGGVVTSPKHLHVIALDQDALDGIQTFITDLCNAPEEALDFNIYSLQEVVRECNTVTQKYNNSFYNALQAVRQKLQDKVDRLPGVHAVVMSSFTTMARTVETAVRGDPTPGEVQTKDYGQAWDTLNAQMSRLQNSFQIDRWHMFWEGHVVYVPKPGGNPNEKEPMLKVHGSYGKEWANNTSHNLLIKRDPMEAKHVKDGKKYDVDRMYLEVKGGGTEFLTGGRRVAGLKSREPDLTVALKTMGYKVGQWGWKGGKTK